MIPVVLGAGPQYFYLIIGRNIIGPKPAIVEGRFRLLKLRENWHLTIQPNPDDRSPCDRVLKNHTTYASARKICADQRCSICAEVTDLNAAFGHHCGRVWIDRVGRLRNQINRFARNTQGDLEPARRAALIEIIGTNDCERHLARHKAV